MRPHPLRLSVLAVVAAGLALSAGQPPPAYDVRDFGAKGDGRTIDTAAINAAIDAAAAAGGGTVYLPAGTYPSYSIRLKSRVTFQLGAGATLLAAAPAPETGRYDAPEPNEHDLYQDFGHSHWQNSLIWGIGLEDVEILGPGRIDGASLTRRGPAPRATARSAWAPPRAHARIPRRQPASPWTGRATRPSR
jgi:polygalacturonase